MNNTNYVKKVANAYNVSYFDEQNRYHRTDGPAIEVHKGVRNWTNYLIHGELHRLDGPAMTHPDGDMFYYRNHQKHRNNGPAEIHCTVDTRAVYKRVWYIKNRIHRFNAPAIIDIKYPSKFYHYGVQIHK